MPATARCRPTEPTGFVFAAASVGALDDALARAGAVFARPELWTQMMTRAMAEPHGWNAAAREYLALYRALVDA